MSVLQMSCISFLCSFQREKVFKILLILFSSYWFFSIFYSKITSVYISNILILKFFTFLIPKVCIWLIFGNFSNPNLYSYISLPIGIAASSLVLHNRPYFLCLRKDIQFLKFVELYLNIILMFIKSCSFQKFKSFSGLIF